MEEIREEVQQKALNSWLNTNKKGTLEIITGLGKTFISLHALCTMPKNDNITHLFLAETTEREKDLVNDILKYKKIFGIDIMKDYNLEFHCYQTVYKWKDKHFGLVISDEIHDALSPQYSKFFYNNSYEAIIGLSATINRNTEYQLPDGEIITKGKLLDDIAPVCFRYKISDGQQDGTARRLNVYVITHKLEDRVKTIKSGSSKKSFYQTEKAAYDYWNSRYLKSFYIEDEDAKKFNIRLCTMKRNNILYNLESKIPIVKKLLDNLESKTIIFGNSLDILLKITPNVVSSRNKDDVNDSIISKFDKGNFKQIASFKKLKQGKNLVGLDNCIITSYYSTDKDYIQRIGRLRNNKERGHVFILVTQGTQEEVWLKKIFENIDNINVIYCPDVDFAIKKYKEW